MYESSDHRVPQTSGPCEPPTGRRLRAHIGTSTLGAIASILTAAGLLTAAAEVTTPQDSAGWQRVPPAASVPLARNLRAGFLVVDGVYNSELMAPYDVLQHTRYHHQPFIETFTVSPDGEPVTTAEGLTLQPHYSFTTAPEIDILVVPSTVGSMDEDLRDEALVSWVRRTGSQAQYVVSLCDGAFVLAAAGLLEGSAVTTFPGDQDRFAAAFPHLDLHRGVSFVHDGKVLTSEGGARSYDVAMYLVDHLYGTDTARGIGGGLIIPWPPRPGSLAALVVH